MINRIMKTGVAAVALAASALLATLPAVAQSGDRFTQDRTFSDLRGGLDTDVQFARNGRREDSRNQRGDRANRGNRVDRGRNHRGKSYLNEYGQSPEEVEYLAAEAIEACACQLELDAYKYGFKESQFHGAPHFEQIGANRFIVKGAAKLYDGYDYSRQSYDCVVKKGRIKDASRLYPATNTKRFDRGRRGQSGNRSRFGQGYSFGGVSFSFGQGW